METKNYQINARKIHFLTLPGEKLLASERKHWFVIVAPLVYIAIFGFLLFSANAYIFLILVPSLLSFFLLLVAILLLTTSIFAKIIVEWYFHVYIITTRKILEISYAPLCSQITNEVLLDQVRCTEVDTKIHGIIGEIVDKGDVIVTFDRPTHEEEFIISDINKPEALGMFLGDMLTTLHPTAQIPHWFGQKNGNTTYNFIDEMAPAINSN